MQAALAASRREQDGTKPALAALPTFPAREVDGVLVHGCYAFLECELDRFVELDDASLVIGRIVAASAVEEAIRDPDDDDAELLRHVVPARVSEPVALRRDRRLALVPVPRLLQPMSAVTAAGLQILDWLRDREEQMTDLLGRLVLAESPSLVPGSETAALELLSDELERAGFRTRVVPATAPATTSSRGREPGGGTAATS